MPRFPILVPAVLLLFAPAVPACVLHLHSASATTLAWDAVDGIDKYEVQESFDDFATSRNYFVATPSFTITRHVTSDTTARYIVTAVLGTNIASIGASAETCTESLTVTLPTDVALRAMTRKAIVPIVGSTAGAFGGKFKTSLKVTANGGGQHGRIVFHPLGVIASPSDPSTTYAFKFVGDSVAFDDIVGLVGQSGLGSVDIVPDEGAVSTVPTVEARLYNDTPAGTFGATTAAVYPFDYLQAPTLTLQVPAGAFRMNVGLRTLTDTKAKVLIYGTDGHLRTFLDLAWPAGLTIFLPVEQFISVPIAPGETAIVYFDGAAIPFYTTTENRTNDPDLFVARPEHSTDVGSYVE